jgi:hypothetical protein
MALLLALFTAAPVISSHAYDFSGTVEKISEANRMTVNVTQPGTYGLQAKVEVLLDSPLPDLSCFKDRVLQFDILGHDILGRPVCDAYLDGINIRHLYFCGHNPPECSYCQSCPVGGWTGRYLYMPCYGRCQPYYPSF